MTKAVFYKEWIKTRRFFLLAIIVSSGFVWYAQMRLGKAFSLKGAAHLWEILLTHDHTFYEVIKYLPLALGVMTALFQFIPEMQQKRLKLTLHLPVAQSRMTAQMLLFGTTMVVLLFAVQNLSMYLFLKRLLAGELVVHILLTTLPWFTAGIAAYGFTAWTVLEPTWRRRIVNALVAAGFLRLLFLSDYAEAYNGIIAGLLLFAFILTGLPLISIERFKNGVQE